MSNFLAIATVTATLGQLIRAAVQHDVPGAEVTTERPDKLQSGTLGTGVNLYLYQVTPNTGWRNADVPTRGPDGRLVQRPLMALDLSYLLSFYGKEGELEPQRLLGCAMRALHDRPVLTRQMIQSTITNPTFAFLAESDLAGAVELVKCTPLTLSLEELAKIWSVFFQTPYTLSVAYQASVVLIEGTETPQEVLPVKEPRIRVTTV